MYVFRNLIKKNLNRETEQSVKRQRITSIKGEQYEEMCWDHVSLVQAASSSQVILFHLWTAFKTA
jgi:hypothetical protein